MDTQTARILDFIGKRPIDPLIALQRFGCMRLAARINDLRRAGHEIITLRKELSNGKSVASYRLIRRAYDQ